MSGTSLVEAFVAKMVVEALNDGVLIRLACVDQAQPDDPLAGRRLAEPVPATRPLTCTQISSSRRKLMICSSEKRLFISNLFLVED